MVLSYFFAMKLQVKIGVARGSVKVGKILFFLVALLFVGLLAAILRFTVRNSIMTIYESP